MEEMVQGGWIIWLPEVFWGRRCPADARWIHRAGSACPRICIYPSGSCGADGPCYRLCRLANVRYERCGGRGQWLPERCFSQQPAYARLPYTEIRRVGRRSVGFGCRADANKLRLAPLRPRSDAHNAENQRNL